MDTDANLDRNQDGMIVLRDLNGPPASTLPMREAINHFDWSSTSIGPKDLWPKELKFLTTLVLDTKFPHFIAWGEDLNLIFNDSFAEIVENPKSAIGAPIEKYWGSAWQIIGPIIKLAMSGTSTLFEDLPIRAMRGGLWKETWWTFAYAPVRQGDGTVAGLFCTATETTRYNAIERKLQESEKALRRFTDFVPNFLWESDAGGHLQYLNRRMQVFTGLKSDAAPDWSTLVHPDDVVHFVAAHAEAQARQGNFECQHRFRAADGSYRWFLSKAQPVFDDEGGVASWYGCATDIHNWRLTIDELRKSEALVRRFSENAARILWIADLGSGRVEYLNAAGRMYQDGESGRKIEGWDDWLALIHPTHQPLIADAIERLRAGETVGGVYRVADRENCYSHLRTTLFPIIDEDGRLEKFGGIAEVVDSPKRRLVHLVDADRDAHRELSTRLWSHGYEVRGFTNVHAFVKVAPALLAGCVVVRLTAETNWLDRVVAAASQQGALLPTIVMSEHARDADHVRDLMKRGAADVLPSDADWESLSASIDEAMRAIDEHAANALNRGAGDGLLRGQRLASLSSREREILERLTGGATNKLVAIDLGISPRTVESHRARIFEKLGVSSLAEAVAITVSPS